jgi:hypothetical protein
MTLAEFEACVEGWNSAHGGKETLSDEQIETTQAFLRTFNANGD